MHSASGIPDAGHDKAASARRAPAPTGRHRGVMAGPVVTKGSIVWGNAAAGFERVADAFACSLAGHPEMGASLSVYLDGRPVVDLWGGVADARAGTAWREDTLGVIFSSTKGLVSLICARLVEDGQLSYDDPVARWWPEFAAAGKHDIRLRDLLAHQPAMGDGVVGIAGPGCPERLLRGERGHDPVPIENVRGP